MKTKPETKLKQTPYCMAPKGGDMRYCAYFGSKPCTLKCSYAVKRLGELQ